MELEIARELSFELMSDFGLYYWKFKFDNAKMRFGLCNELTKTISLSKHLVLINDDKIVEQVILHEIAHALVGNRHHHNSIFQQKALNIGCNFTTSCASEGIIHIPKNVIANCSNCGKIYKRYRIPSIQYSCGKCSEGKFNEKYLLEYKRLYGSQHKIKEKTR